MMVVVMVVMMVLVVLPCILTTDGSWKRWFRGRLIVVMMVMAMVMAIAMVMLVMVVLPCILTTDGSWKRWFRGRLRNTMWDDTLSRLPRGVTKNTSEVGDPGLISTTCIDKQKF